MNPYQTEVLSEFSRCMKVSGMDKEWRVRVREQASEDADAEVGCVPEDRTITLCLGEQADSKLTPVDIGRHEWLHCALWVLLETTKAVRWMHPLAMGEEHSAIARILAVMHCLEGKG